jgi:uncharacterized membrane protein
MSRTMRATKLSSDSTPEAGQGASGPKRALTNSRTIALTAIFTAFVFVTTWAFTIGIPTTNGGYFDVGEIMVYIVAILEGPYVGAIASGVGSMLSDAAVSPAYAPGTLVIKAAEGFVVGYLTNRTFSGQTRSNWRILSVVMGLAVGGLIAYLGTTYWSVSSYQFLIGPFAFPNFDIPSLFWIALGIVALVGILLVGVFTDEKIGYMTLAILAGGSIMVLGYFLYNIAFIEPLAPAVVEVPFDIGQALIGLLVAIPVVRRVRRLAGRHVGAR